MAISPSDFIPTEASWPFHEANSGQELILRVTSHPVGNERLVELNAPPSHVFTGFFDRLTVSSAALTLTRLHLQRQIVTPQPPLAVTMDNAPNHTANLFAGLNGAFPNSSPPYDGTVIFKEVKEVTVPGSQDKDTVWTILIESRSRERSIVFRPHFFFSRKFGLIFYTGDVYGVFFVYIRSDVGKRYRPLAGKVIAPG